MLGARDVVVFLARPEALKAPARREAAVAVLDDDDRAHVARLRFERDRQVALASRALQRRALSRCVEGRVAPAAWRFEPGGDGGAGGKPRIAGDAMGLTFNVSNTRGLVACAVARGRAVGVDVEPVPAEVPADVVESHFAAVERAGLRALPAERQARRFAALWTMKEAYLKARGIGLGGLELDRFWFAEGVGLVLGEGVDDDAARWQVSCWAPTAEHVAALCVARGEGGEGARIATRWMAGDSLLCP